MVSSSANRCPPNNAQDLVGTEAAVLAGLSCNGEAFFAAKREVTPKSMAASSNTGISVRKSVVAASYVYIKIHVLVSAGPRS